MHSTPSGITALCTCTDARSNAITNVAKSPREVNRLFLLVSICMGEDTETCDDVQKN